MLALAERELRANDGLMLDSAQPVFAKRPWLLTVPACWELGADLEVLGGDDACSQQRLAALKERLGALALPVHPSVDKNERRVIQRGRWLRTASPRTFIATEGSKAWQGVGFKLHLPDALYSRLGGLRGSRELSRADAMMALSVSRTLSPIVSALGARLELERMALVAHDHAGTRAALVRDRVADAVSGYALASTRGHLLGEWLEPIAFADRPQAVFDALIAPLLTVFFGLAARGVAFHMHGQNLAFVLQPGVAELVLRDMDAFVVPLPIAESLFAREALPEQILQHWVREQTDGCAPRDYFTACFDDHLSSFLFRLLLAAYRRQLLVPAQIEVLQDAVVTTVRKLAQHHGIVLGSLFHGPGLQGFWRAVSAGTLRGYSLFR